MRVGSFRRPLRPAAGEGPKLRRRLFDISAQVRQQDNSTIQDTPENPDQVNDTQANDNQVNDDHEEVGKEETLLNDPGEDTGDKKIGKHSTIDDEDPMEFESAIAVQHDESIKAILDLAQELKSTSSSSTTTTTSLSIMKQSFDGVTTLKRILYAFLCTFVFMVVVYRPLYNRYRQHGVDVESEMNVVQPSEQEYLTKPTTDAVANSMEEELRDYIPPTPTDPEDVVARLNAIEGSIHGLSKAMKKKQVAVEAKEEEVSVLVEKMVARVLDHAQVDRVGMADYAAEEGGARVVYEMTSATYDPYPQQKLGKPYFII
jgi:hypothetical protein